jgi:excisionase family DNA binding protein
VDGYGRYKGGRNMLGASNTDDGQIVGPLLISVEECARRLGIGRSSCWILVQRGELAPTVTIGRRRLLVAAAVSDYIARLVAEQSQRMGG